MDLFKIAAAGVISVVLGAVVGQYKPEFKIYISLATGAIIFGAVIGVLSPVFDLLLEFSQRADIDSLYAKILLKCLAVCYIAGMAGDISRDAGDSAVANKIDLAGKVAVTVISVPLWKDLVDLVINLTGK